MLIILKHALKVSVICVKKLFCCNIHICSAEFTVSVPTYNCCRIEKIITSCYSIPTLEGGESEKASRTFGAIAFAGSPRPQNNFMVITFVGSPRPQSNFVPAFAASTLTGICVASAIWNLTWSFTCENPGNHDNRLPLSTLSLISCHYYFSPSGLGTRLFPTGLYTSIVGENGFIVSFAGHITIISILTIFLRLI